MAGARNAIRHGFSQLNRLALLENDADNIESALTLAMTEMKEFVGGEVSKVRSSMRWVAGSFFALVLAIVSALAVLAFK